MKVSKRNILWAVPILLIIALFYYFKPSESVDHYIAFAEEAVLVEDSTYTFKETFNQYCNESNWEYFETSKRVDVVEFKGQCEVDGENQPVNLQLILEEDLKEYTVGALLVNYTPIKGEEKQNLIQHIYDAYTP